MAEDRLRALPVEFCETVRSALKAAFGPVGVDGVTPITGGASDAFPFRAEIGGRSYLVRVEGAASPLRNPHQYDSMRIAAQAGIAPKIYHIDESARVAVVDFIEERSLSAFPGGPPALAPAIGEMLRRVQTTPLFPKFVEYPDIVSRLWAWVCRTGLFAPGALDPYTERLESIREAYARHPASSVSSHNDFVRRNVLFDGERLWLIDWESAYRNDPLVDVAIALDSFAASPELESMLLDAWLGCAPDDAFYERLALVRPLTRLYYAGVLLSASFAASGALADRDLSSPTLPGFQRAIRNGRFEPGMPQTKHILGKMYLASFMTGTAPPELDAAV
jgi:aminoglycoside phosphotransferase (APT) family kinase protein